MGESIDKRYNKNKNNNKNKIKNSYLLRDAAERYRDISLIIFCIKI